MKTAARGLQPEEVSRTAVTSGRKNSPAERNVDHPSLLCGMKSILSELQLVFSQSSTTFQFLLLDEHTYRKISRCGSERVFGMTESYKPYSL